MADLVIVEGIPETEAALHTLLAVTVPAAANRGAEVGAGLLRDAIRAATDFAGESHVNPGGLLRGINYVPVPEGYLVGPMGPGTEYAPYVIGGHEVRHRKGGPVSGRTRPNSFVERGQAAAEAAVIEVVTVAVAASVA